MKRHRGQRWRPCERRALDRGIESAGGGRWSAQRRMIPPRATGHRINRSRPRATLRRRSVAETPARKLEGWPRAKTDRAPAPIADPRPTPNAPEPSRRGHPRLPFVLVFRARVSCSCSIPGTFEHEHESRKLDLHARRSGALSETSPVPAVTVPTGYSTFVVVSSVQNGRFGEDQCEDNARFLKCIQIFEYHPCLF